MKLFFQICFWIGIGSISIFFLTLSIIQRLKYRKHGYLRHLFVPLTESEGKLYTLGGIFLLVGVISFIASVIYHYRYGLN